MAMQKKTNKKATTATKAHSFMNWEVLNKKGELTGIKGSQALRDNEYASAGERWIMEQLDKRGGEEFTITMTVKVRSGDKAVTLDVEPDDII